jgi:4-carboxymuconolactone decarboxylase
VDGASHCVPRSGQKKPGGERTKGVSEFDPQERAARGVRAAAELKMFLPDKPRTPVEAAWRDFVYADIWTRPGLDRRSRFIISLCGMAVAPGPENLLDALVGAALDSGELTLAELRETALHLTGYGGFPQGTRLDCAISRVAKEKGLTEPEVEPIRARPWTMQARRTENAASFHKVMTSPGPPQETAFIEAGVMNYCFGELWTRPGLDQRSRRLITIVGAADSQAPAAVRSHTFSAMASGDFTREEMLEIVEHYAVHGGHTRGSTMQALVLEMADKIEKGEAFAAIAHNAGD